MSSSVLFVIAAIVIVASLPIFGSGDSMDRIIAGSAVAIVGIVIGALGAILKQVEGGHPEQG